MPVVSFNKRKLSLYFPLTILCNLLITCICFPENKLNFQELDWNRIKIAYDSFMDYPSPENALLLLGLIPPGSTENEKGDRGRTLDFIFSRDNYVILKNEILAGERNATEIGFRLLKYADAGYSEQLYLTLGELIRLNPKLFVETLYTLSNLSPYFKKAEPPVYMVDEAYFVRIPAYIYELEKRIQALETIANPSYQKVKDECIKRIRSAIKEIGN